MNAVRSPEAWWEHFPHGADVGLHGVGSTKAEAFEQAALALTGVLTDPSGVRPDIPVPISCSAADEELLLVEWLNALVFEMATRRMVFGEFDVQLDDGQLTAVASGEPIDPARHAPAVEVKGATCTELSVRQDANLWHARCVVDV